jgi:nucleoside-diphosphate-sugar epimerase
MPVSEIARRVLRLTPGGRIETRPWPEADLRVETGDFRCSVSRIRKAIGWSPTIPFEAGLRETIASYRAELESELGLGDGASDR